MSTTGRPDANAPAASDIAGRLRDAGFVLLVADRTGDAVAAAGLLARALDTCDVPYQTSVVSLPDSAKRATDADLTVAVGRPVSTADVAIGLGGPASETALRVVHELDTATDRETATRADDVVLALAGVLAAGVHPGDELLGAAQAQGIDRRPGIAVPTADPGDGLAHSSLVHAPFSGSTDRAGQALADIAPESGGDTDHHEGQWDTEGRRQIASLVALTITGDEDATPRAAESTERFLRPHVGGPFETVGGYADVIEATARERPGLAVGLVLGVGDRETALSVWRSHNARAHEAVREARTGRYDGLFVVRCDDAPVETVARLARDFRSPEPVVLAVDSEVAAVVAIETADVHVGALLDGVAASIDGEGAGTRLRGRLRFDTEPSETVLAVREAV